LMGPSGSGKTTLLNLIGGLDSPTDGSINVSSERIDRLGEGALAKWRASNVGFVFQFYNLLPMLTARRNVELPLLLTRLGSGQRKRNADVALQLVGLADRATHKPGELSGGQQQRVAIARAIVSDPTLLVCDEPTGDLDRQSATEVLTLMQELNRDHSKTIVMVTHDPKAAEYAHRTLHLDKADASQDAHDLHRPVGVGGVPAVRVAGYREQRLRQRQRESGGSLQAGHRLQDQLHDGAADEPVLAHPGGAGCGRGVLRELVWRPVSGRARVLSQSGRLREFLRSAPGVGAAGGAEARLQGDPHRSG